MQNRLSENRCERDGVTEEHAEQVEPDRAEQHARAQDEADAGDEAVPVRRRLVGERRCPPGTLIVLELGAAFGPLIAGASGALLFETWAGDPRPVPANKEEYYALLKAKGIVRLPNPKFTKPDTAPKQKDDGKDLYS